MIGKKPSLKDRLAAKAKKTKTKEVKEPETEESTDVGDYEPPTLTDAQVEYLGNTLGRAIRDFVFKDGSFYGFENKIKELLKRERTR